MEANSVDSIVTDPPYGLRFMQAKWDYDVPSIDVWRECLRVLKPGGHMLAFGGARTYHRLVTAIEDAGFEIRDQIMWIFAQGFPKSLDVSKAIDKDAGATREVVGEWHKPGRGKRSEEQKYGLTNDCGTITAPATDAAREWEGWGTALKPAHEPICVARKPLSESTVAKNVLKWGTGGINVDGCRVGTEVLPEAHAGQAKIGTFKRGEMITPERTGRFPANLILDEALEPVLSLIDSSLSEASELIKGWFRDYDQLSGLRRVSGDVSQSKVSDEILQPGMLLEKPERSNEGREALHVWQDALGSDEEEIEGSTSQDGCGSSIVEGRILQPGLQDDPHRHASINGSGALSVDGANDEQTVYARAQTCDGEAHRSSVDAKRDSASRERAEGRQPDREPGATRRVNARKGTSGAHSHNTEATLLVRKSDVPVLWEKYFEPSGYEIRTRDCAAAALDEQTGDLGKSQGGSRGAGGKHGRYSEIGAQPDVKPGFGDSGGASRFFYQAKSSKADRNKGCEDLITWESVDQSLLDQAARSSQHARDTLDGTTQTQSVLEWSTSWSGKLITDLFRTARKSTTSTALNPTTASKIWNALLHLSTKENILAAIRMSEANGLSLAVLVESTSQSPRAITSDQTESMLTASHALFNALLQIKEQGKTGNVHSTVKPIALMAYLCRLITPPNGLVLDPFAGSGSTGVGALREGFRFVGIEREAEYVEIAKRRLVAS
jgi:hypothetical protein